MKEALYIMIACGLVSLLFGTLFNIDWFRITVEFLSVVLVCGVFFEFYKFYREIKAGKDLDDD
jgi:hypothetical protein